MTVIAFDLGLRNTGYAWTQHNIDKPSACTITTPNILNTSPMTSIRQQARHNWWTTTLRLLCDQTPPSTILVEAPFLHRLHPTGSMSTIRLHGALWSIAGDLGVPIVELEPAALKSWATGNGNATKEQMIEAANLRGWHGTEPDAADAWLLLSWWTDPTRDGDNT